MPQFEIHPGTLNQITIGKIAVAGAGTMGQGIAQVCATAGFHVQLFDAVPGVVEKAVTGIRKNLQAALEKGKLNGEEMSAIVSRLHPVSIIENVHADLIIEAIIEKLEPKIVLLTHLEKLNPSSILASNTSTFPIAQLAAALRDPGNCVGLHFFNPAPLMKLVEIIAGKSTRPGVMDAVKDISLRLGKIAVIANDSPGFIVNRVARHFYLESLRILEEGGASVETIDKLMVTSGFKMGPFALMDVIGIDVNLAVTKSLYEAFGQAPKFRPSIIQERLADAGHWGRKTGRGFYEYPEV